MDASTLILVIIGIFALLFVLAMVLFPDFRGKITGPGSTSIDLEGRRGQQQAMAHQDEALVEHVKAKGNVDAAVETGGGKAGVRHTEAGGDVSARVSGPRDAEGDEDPKD